MRFIFGLVDFVTIRQNLESNLHWDTLLTRFAIDVTTIHKLQYTHWRDERGWNGYYSGAFFILYHQGMRVSFRENKVIKHEAYIYRYNCKDKCNWIINLLHPETDHAFSRTSLLVLETVLKVKV